MKDKFKQYHIIDELDKIHNEALIILDTNSLLNLYRYSEDTRAKYFEILKKVEDRLYLTHHVCSEFYRNRLSIIENRSTFKETVLEYIEDHFNKLLNVIKNANGISKYNSALSILKHESELKEEILNEIEESLSKIGTSIRSFEQDLDLKYVQDRDPILAEVVDIFDKKISKELSKDELEDLYLKGKERYENKIPPGYKDEGGKGHPEKYGDYIIWEEMQIIAKEQKRDVLFVSDDRKEDWAIKFKGYDLGPRKELIKEFLDNTKQLFYSITTNGFIKLISENYSVDDTQSLEEETEIIHKNIEERERSDKQIWMQSNYAKDYLDYLKNQQSYSDALKEILKKKDYNTILESYINKSSLPVSSYESVRKYLDSIERTKTDIDYLNEYIELKNKPTFGRAELQEYLDKLNKHNKDKGDAEDEEG